MLPIYNNAFTIYLPLKKKKKWIILLYIYVLNRFPSLLKYLFSSFISCMHRSPHRNSLWSGHFSGLTFYHKTRFEELNSLLDFQFRCLNKTYKISFSGSENFFWLR